MIPNNGKVLPVSMAAEMIYLLAHLKIQIKLSRYCD